MSAVLWKLVFLCIIVDWTLAAPAPNDTCKESCPADCGKTKDENGCMVCDCSVNPFTNVKPSILPDSCGPPNCKSPCILEFQEAGCPICNCNTEKSSDATCKQSCPADCGMTRDENNCSICNCAVSPFRPIQRPDPCGPPNCKRPCVLQLQENACPICQCPNNTNTDDVDPSCVKECPAFCAAKKDDNGCLECLCQVAQKLPEQNEEGKDERPLVCPSECAPDCKGTRLENGCWSCECNNPFRVEMPADDCKQIDCPKNCTLMLVGNDTCLSCVCPKEETTK